MNIVFPSNTTGLGRENHNNDFIIPMVRVIDASTDAYIEVLNVIYPNTISNVGSKCFFSIKMDFSDLTDATSFDAGIYLPANFTDRARRYFWSGNNNKFTYDTRKIYFPEGVYNLEKILKVMNNYMEEYSIKISLDAGGKINIKWNSFFQSWFMQETSELGIVEIYRQFNKVYGHGRNQTLTPINIFMGENQPFDGYTPDQGLVNPQKSWRLFHSYNSKFVKFTTKGGGVLYQGQPFPKLAKFAGGHFPSVKLEITFSDSLKYMLGFDDDKITFQSENEWVQENIEPAQSVRAKYLPDIENGVSALYIYCNELESSMVGDSNSELLCIIPLSNQQDQPVGANISHQPPSTRKKFKKNHINNLHFTIKDSSGQLIPFDYGKVVIEALIHHA